MNRRRRAREVINFVDFDIKRKGNVVAQNLEIRIIKQVGNIGATTGKIIVDAENVVAIRQKPFTQMGAQKAGSPGNQDTFD